MSRTHLNAAALAENFADLHPNYTRDEATAESSRCLFCYDAPCTRACPTHIDVPRFIRQILHNNAGGAAETIFTENIFGGSCARACPTEVLCEGACVERTMLHMPIQIGRLQRYATDYAYAKDLRFFEPGKATGKKVAIIGSGPAGMACAHELRRLGHAVTVFEARDVPGGLNTIGIAYYKISTEFALQELQPILEMGVELKLNSPVDAAGFKKLRKDYDAVFLGVGLGMTQRLDVPGEDIPGVWEGLDFVFQSHRRPLAECEVGKTVVVIGAGNTAVDCATEAVRLGAGQVIMAYRRTSDAMPAYDYEFELAKSDGITFEWLAAPVEFIATNGALSGVKLQRMKLEGEGRKAQLVAIPGSEFVVECDMAIKALGQSPLNALLSSIEGITFEKGKVAIDETGATHAPGVFGGGDCTSKGAEIVNAVQEGKLGARAIDAYLKKA